MKTRLPTRCQALLGNESLIGNIWDNSEVSNSFSKADVTGHNRIGGFTGYVSESSVINCYSVGKVIGNKEVGDLVGTSGRSVITNSHSMSNISADDELVGGLVSYNSREAVIMRCFIIGTVSAGANNVGGLVGQNYQSIIAHSFSTGFVSGETAVGVFSGFIDTGGSFEEKNNYCDTETSGQASSAGGEGRTTEQMTYPYDENTYVNWDFEEIWKADVDGDINNGYPYIKEDPVSVNDGYILSKSSVSLSNYPNPFNIGTNISFSLLEKTSVTINIYNTKGQIVRKLISNQDYPEGSNHSFYWDGKNNRGQAIPSGVYLYHMETEDDYSETKKMILLK